MVADKRKVLDDDSDDDFAPSAEASPVEKPSKKKSKPKAPKAKPDTDGGAPKEKKPKQEANLDYGVDITQYDQSPELTEKYSAMSVTELNQWLKANRVVKGPANKANLVARCVDGELFGAEKLDDRELVALLLDDEAGAALFEEYEIIKALQTAPILHLARIVGPEVARQLKLRDIGGLIVRFVNSDPEPIRIDT